MTATAAAAEARTRRVALYCRESKDHAGDEHNVADQLAVLSAACATRGWDVLPGGTFTDNDLSATERETTPEVQRDDGAG